ncbi:MAG TPA: hypothetical protein VFQ40_08285, partial [Actinomycetota bacterium]|nr:hypothetical protein [Actinomycetota bacterium]
MASNKRWSMGKPVVWLAAAVLSAGLAAGAWFLKSSTVDSGIRAAERSATAAVRRQLEPTLTAGEVREPMSKEASEALQPLVESKLLDGQTMTVRIWTVSGTLVYSSTGEATGTRGGDTRGIRKAADGKTTSIPPASEGGALTIYVPLRPGSEEDPAAVVELVDDFTPIAGSAAQPWGLVQSVGGGVAALALLMAVVSFAALRAGRFGGKEAMGFARAGGGQVDDEKVRRIVAARDEQLTQLREQLKEREAETVERMRELEMQVREAEARAKEAEARASEADGASESVQEANRHAQELLDRAVRAESELSSVREQLREMPASAPGASDDEVRALREQLRSTQDERDRARVEAESLAQQVLDAQARAQDAATQAEALRASAAEGGASADQAARRAAEEAEEALAESERRRVEIEAEAARAGEALVTAEARIASLEAERERLLGDVESDRGEVAARL